jgi:hypothetical protein
LLVVCIGVKEPQSLEPQLTDHLVPTSLVSLVSKALSCAVALTGIDFGGDVSDTTTGRLTIVNATLDFCDGSLVTAAVTVTMVPTGISAGAV